jgi:hypothetical protein
MKKLLPFIALLSFSLACGQVRLEPKDLQNLIAIAQIYSANTNASGDNFAKSMDSLRTPVLAHIVDALIEVGKGDEKILEDRFLQRPGHDELMMWYVIREIHYNNVSKSSTHRPAVDVANEVLSQKIDERWLLDNYYYRIHGGIASLFNEADLSKVDINIENLGFKDQTEKAIFYFNMVDALIGGRFRVLSSLKKYDRIVEFSRKLPKFNGKEYYYYTDFDFEDFDWVGYDKSQSYKMVNLGTVYEVLSQQLVAFGNTKNSDIARGIYANSILDQPKYFDYSGFKEDLQKMHSK